MTKKSITQSDHSVKIKLLTLLTQELLTPLTSVMGMASVLNQGIYGPLTDKQREYVEVINESSRYLRSLVEEIIALAKLEGKSETLDKTAVDLKNLCQQIVRNLEVEAAHLQVEIKLLGGPSDRILLLDKAVVEQALHNLILSVIQSAAGSGSGVKIHLSEKQQELNVAVWVSHPILGDNLPHSQLYSQQLSEVQQNHSNSLNRWQLTLSELKAIIFNKIPDKTGAFATNQSREMLGLLLSCQLAEKHGGSLSVQGSAELGYRYIMNIPLSNPVEIYNS
ncbi:MAG: histidine kinase dimerization/phospho-acceptor domain-containing protein [Microcoleaceae cyanobacterium MO_207.B10]|nr:histidine kinase dimerization/phospho-acceptor domain-containing protein [Microcoleaceae cyanobacterium MO_207.B10]